MSKTILKIAASSIMFLALAFALGPTASQARPSLEFGTWQGNCPPAGFYTGSGSLPVVGSCEEVNYTMACVRTCDIVSVNGILRKTNCVLSD